MSKKSKILKTLTIFGTALCAPLLLSGCTQAENKTDFRVYNGYIQTTTDGKTWKDLVSLNLLKGADGDDADVWTIGSDGFWYCNGVKTNNRTTGVPGTPGGKGNGIKSISKDIINSTVEKTVYIIELDDGVTYQFEVVNGTNGADGDDADVWTIGNDGYWYKNGVITEYKAVGTDGENGTNPTITISNDGYWVINGEKTDKIAVGTNGQNGTDGTDADQWTIGNDGYWYKNGAKTEYKAVGKDGAKGEDGITPTISISDDGYWIINGEKTDIIAKRQDVKVTLSFNSTTIIDDIWNKQNPSENEYDYICEIDCGYGESLDLPLVTNVFGYEFDGWYSTTNGEITANDGKVTNLTNFTKDITLVPKFKGYEANHTVEKDGITYNYENYNSIRDITLDEGIENIEIPYGTRSINLDDNKVFEKDSYNLIIPKTLIHNTMLVIYGDSFVERVGNIEINFDSENVEEYVDYSFSSFRNLKKVKFNCVVTGLYSNTFNGCEKLTTVLDKLSYSTTGVHLNKCSFFGNSAFENTAITEFTWQYNGSENVKFVDDVFKNSKIANIIINNMSETAKVYVDSNTLKDCENLSFVSVSSIENDVNLPTVSGFKWVMYDSNQEELLLDNVTIVEKHLPYRVYLLRNNLS